MADEDAVFEVMDIVNVVFDLPATSPVVNLREAAAPFRAISFPIGLPEAQAIALALHKERGTRPGSHELFNDVLAVTGVDIVAVRLTGARDGAIHAELDLMGPRGHEVLDCRPSDGIALAVRQSPPAPLLCDVTLLEA
jgi:hypothetical protein